MEYSVMASKLGQPVADGKIYAGGNKPTADGLFGIMINAEIAKLIGSEKSGEKKAGQAAGDPMILLLMSAFMQVINFQANPTEPISGDTAQVAPDGQQENQVNAAANGMVPNAAALGIQQLLFSDKEIVNAVKELFSGNSHKNEALLQLLAAVSQETTGAAGMLIQPSMPEEPAFSALLSALGGNPAEPAAGQPPDAGMNVLKEIRQLFNELIAAEPVVPKALEGITAPARPMAQQGGLVQPVMPVSQEQPSSDVGIVEAEPLSAPAKALLQKIETLIKSIQGQAAAPDGTQTQDAVLADEKAGIAGERKPQAAKQYHDTESFGAAMRANHSNVPTAVSGAVEPKAVAAAAKPGAEAFDSIVQSITQMQGSSQKEMEIHLKPDFMGKVVIRLSMDEGGLVAKIAASNPKVQDAFLSNASALQSSLADQGLKDVRIVVMSSSVQDPSLQQQADRRGQGQNPHHKRSRLAVDALEQPDRRAFTAYEAVYNTGSINCLA